jgi:hypothetical protein
MTEKPNNRFAIFFTLDGFSVHRDPDVELLLGRKEMLACAVYRDNSLEDWFFRDAKLPFPPAPPDELDR